MEYKIKVKGIELAAFCRDHIWDSCVDALHMNRKAHGVSIGKHVRGRVIDFTDACKGDDKIIQKFKRMAAEYAKIYGH